jgi:hypothetical protein
MFYKIRNNNAPSYLCDCLLPFERNENVYNLLNQTDYSNPFTRLQLYRNSFFPSSIKFWNNLTPEIRSAPRISSFKKSLMHDVNLVTQFRYYAYGYRVLNVLHTRLKHRSSNLNTDLLWVNLINDPGCVYGWVIEDAIHFFLECCLYVEAREQLTNNLQFLDSLLIETLLFGDDSLSEGKMHKYSNQCSCTSNKRNVLRSLIKFTLKRSAFKLLDLCLSLVCRTFNTLQPYK